jgi:flagellar biogenesis protein FliO
MTGTNTVSPLRFTTELTDTAQSNGLLEGAAFGTSTAELTLRMGLALAVVLLLMFTITAIIRRRGGADSGGPRIQIRHQQQLSKHTTLTLLSAGTEHLLIASSNSETTLLAKGRSLTSDPNALRDDDGANPRIGSGQRQAPRSGAGAGTGPAAGRGRQTQIDVRGRSGPLKQLQEKTVRRG